MASYLKATPKAEYLMGVAVAFPVLIGESTERHFSSHNSHYSQEDNYRELCRFVCERIPREVFERYFEKKKPDRVLADTFAEFWRLGRKEISANGRIIGVENILAIADYSIKHKEKNVPVVSYPFYRRILKEMIKGMSAEDIERGVRDLTSTCLAQILNA